MQAMDQLSSLTAWRDVLFQIATEFSTRVAAFLPSLLGAILIVAVGWLVSRAVEIAAARALRSLGFDRAAARVRFTAVLDRAELGMAPSEVIARLLFWTLMLTFLLSGVETLGLSAVSTTIDRLIAYIPNLIGAAVIALGGLLLARFVGTLVSSGAAAAGFPSAPRLGFTVQALVTCLVAVLVVEQLGIATSILVGPLTALLAAAGLSVGLAFALGAYPIITHILAGHFLKESLPRDSFIEAEGRRGVVERIGATDTVLRDGDESWSVPNATLLGWVVKR
jgi:hypothetical protein